MNQMNKDLETKRCDDQVQRKSDALEAKLKDEIARLGQESWSSMLPLSFWLSNLVLGQVQEQAFFCSDTHFFQYLRVSRVYGVSEVLSFVLRDEAILQRKNRRVCKSNSSFHGNVAVVLTLRGGFSMWFRISG